MGRSRPESPRVFGICWDAIPYSQMDPGQGSSPVGRDSLGCGDDFRSVNAFPCIGVQGSQEEGGPLFLPPSMLPYFVGISLLGLWNGSLQTWISS